MYEPLPEAVARGECDAIVSMATYARISIDDENMPKRNCKDENWRRAIYRRRSCCN